MDRNDSGVVTVPPDLGDAFRVGLGLDEPPETVAELTDAFRTRLEASGISTDVDVLCTVEDSRHRARIDGETMHFHCVLDALIAPFVIDSSGGVRVESRSPTAGTTVTMAVRDGTFEITPPDSVVSLGMTPDAPVPTEGPPTPQMAYVHFCPYVNAFPDSEAYREWADDVDVPTMEIPARDAYEFGRVLGRSF